MTEFFKMMDDHWEDLLPALAEPFTTQTFRALLEQSAPHVWGQLVERYGPGGKRSGKFYSPANVLYNYLNDKARKDVLLKRGFTPSQPGWGTHVVMQFELVGSTLPPPTQDDKTFIEGKPAYRLHLVRERAAGLRKRLLASRGASGLICDLCGTTGETVPEDVREGVFEAHHKNAPLSATGETVTTVDDLALLCATCHRMIHRLAIARGRWFSVIEARGELKAY